jgi:hypothetical protein
VVFSAPGWGKKVVGIYQKRHKHPFGECHISEIEPIEVDFIYLIVLPLYQTI